MEKKWYESKTIWANIISLMIVVISEMMGWAEFKDYAPQMLVAVNVMNLMLRMMTSEGIK